MDEMTSPLSLAEYEAMPVGERHKSNAFQRLTQEDRNRFFEQEEERREARRAEDMERYRREECQREVNKLPQELLTTFDLSQHPCSSAHAEVMAWVVGKIGMMLVGSTGMGKSRSLLQLLSKLIWQDVQIIYWPAPRVADKISALAFESSGELDKFIHRLESCPVLAIDDLGAHRPTERVCQELHRVIDTRYSEGRPLLVSSNCTPAQLQKRLLDEHGRTIRRLQDVTKAVHFAKSEPHASGHPGKEAAP